MLGIALAVPLGQASAQEAAPEPTTTSAQADEIVVTANSARDQAVAVHRQARSIAVAEDPRRTPLARFEGDVCIGIMGLADEHAGFMIDRLRDNARALDIGVQGDGCSPNFVVSFTRDAQGAMTSLRENSGYLFAFLDQGDKRELFDRPEESPQPVYVWTNIQNRSRDGMPVPATRDLVNPPVVQMAMAHSKIYTATYPDIATVLVVFDQALVSGMSLLQLADYATMRGFARTQAPAGEPAMDTILTLFESDGNRPPALTEFDRAYLQSVYAWLPNLPAAAKLGGVNRQLRILAGADGEAGQAGEGGSEE